ncbi:DUF2793 domain-containing protein [Aurantimonas sp. MSK8Z-1]|uniref:DUF2793 domain-containing protein n=1 Tax=Mangrovibrevibacter kandeliae TaxID=2968473 RepID=UPI0021198EC6|nr:DUF2793 domain-containing protein [Aurantimonas sp. MSK8Z-1]MCW4116746.1 DUF2793 domain-containing protein [Aurantimonas sp. MSK8Z-1]
MDDSSISADCTPNLSLPFLMPSQAQKHVTHNEALAILDALVQLTVESDTLTAPPESPAAGARYFVAPDATGDWTGQSGRLALFQDGAWTFLVPGRGWQAYVASRGSTVLFDGSVWAETGAAPDLAALADRRVTELGINTAADGLNRLSVAAAATLLNHEGGDHRLKINKGAVPATALLIWQSGYSGRAELGLAGSDELSLKVSADGSAWREALRVCGTSGELALADGLRLAPGAKIRSTASGPDAGAEIIGGSDLGPVSLRIVNESSIGVAGAVFEQRTTLGEAADLIDFALKTVTEQVNIRVEARAGTATGGTPELQFSQVNGTTIRPFLLISPVQALVQVPFALQAVPLAALPSGAGLRPGALVYVDDAPGGGAPACWDGQHWRAVHDRTVLA